MQLRDKFDVPYFLKNGGSSRFEKIVRTPWNDYKAKGRVFFPNGISEGVIEDHNFFFPYVLILSGKAKKCKKKKGQ